MYHHIRSNTIGWCILNFSPGWNRILSNSIISPSTRTYYMMLDDAPLHRTISSIWVQCIAVSGSGTKCHKTSRPMQIRFIPMEQEQAVVIVGRIIFRIQGFCIIQQQHRNIVHSPRSSPSHYYWFTSHKSDLSDQSIAESDQCSTPEPAQ